MFGRPTVMAIGEKHVRRLLLGEGRSEFEKSQRNLCCFLSLFSRWPSQRFLAANLCLFETQLQ